MKSGETYKSIYGSDIKIMAIVDGYVMARYKGCIPFIRSVKEFEKLLSINKSNEFKK